MSRAGTGARDQVARLLTLVPLLHARDEMAVEEAAAALGTTPAQVVKDLKVLLMCGLPGGMPDDLIDVDLDALEDGGDGVIHVRNADYLAHPVRLSPTEATALVVALRAVRDTAGPDARDVVDRALAKLEQAAAEGAAYRQVEVAADVPTHDRTRSALEEAVRSRRQVRMSYFVPKRDERTERVVDPLQVATVRGADYLEAFCHQAGARRVFRLDRIDALEVLEAPVEHPDERPSDLSASLFEAPEGSQLVTLSLSADGRWVTEYYPVEAVREVGDDGSLEVDLLVSDLRWLEQLVLRLAPSASVREPARVRERALGSARRALDLYA